MLLARTSREVLARTSREGHFSRAADLVEVVVAGARADRHVAKHGRVLGTELLPLHDRQRRICMDSGERVPRGRPHNRAAMEG